MNHPMIEQIERTGYPQGYIDHEFSGSDLLGNELLSGDEVLKYEGETILMEVLNVEAIEAFKLLGATVEIMK